MEAVLSGSQYERSLIGMQVIKEMFGILKWEAFWQSEGREDGGDVIEVFKHLQLTFNSKVPTDSAAAAG